jgi:glycosyltransferase involved in cell wall biosynthesis
MGSMKIIYLCPATTKPSGGVARIFRHVEILHRLGYDAWVGLPKNFDSFDWFESEAPVIHFSTMNIDEGDVLVVPDAFLHVIEPLIDYPIKRVVLAFGFLSPFYRLPYGHSWEDYKIDAVIANNPDIVEFLYYSKIWPVSKPIHVVTTPIDKRRFYYDPKKKENIVACINKHQDVQVEMIRKITKLRKHDWTFIELGDLSLDEYSSVLRHASIFMCQMYCEGFSVPILEAMACGCLCVGSPGVGGESFIIDNSIKSMRLGRSVKNFFTVKAGDIFGYAKTLCQAMELVETKREPIVSTLINNGIATASQFTVREEEESVINFWKGFVEDIT